jgi:hypothetical protein
VVDAQPGSRVSRPTGVTGRQAIAIEIPVSRRTSPWSSRVLRQALEPGRESVRDELLGADLALAAVLSFPKRQMRGGPFGTGVEAERVVELALI